MSNLPRAYLRMDPNMHNHPDPGSLVIIICIANQQPHRGRFKSLHFLSRALGKRKLSEAIDRRDIVKSGDVYYVSGWDEWQEGDLTVGERMNRVRGRRTTEIRDSEKSNRNAGVTQPSPERIHASKTIDVDVDVDVTPPPPRVIPPVPNDADCQAAADELVKALRRAKEVTGLDGAEILGSSKVRGKTVILNPTVCSPAALKLWQVTTERVYGFIAAWEADRREANEKRTKPGKNGGAPSWDRGDQAETDLTDQAIAWVDANWPTDSRPETRADLEGLLSALTPPASLSGPILIHLLFGRYPDLREGLATAGSRPETKGTPEPKATEQSAVKVFSRPTACPECGVEIVEDQPGSYRCADSDGLGCTWSAVLENQPAEQSA